MMMMMDDDEGRVQQSERDPDVDSGSSGVGK